MAVLQRLLLLGSLVLLSRSYAIATGLRWSATLGGLYRSEVPAALRRSRLALRTVCCLGQLGRVWLPISPFPMGVFRLDLVSGETCADIPVVGGLPAFTVRGVLSNNMRSLLVAAFVAGFSCGVMAVALLMIPMAVTFGFRSAGRICGA